MDDEFSALSAMADPAERLEVLFSRYERETGHRLGRPPSPAERQAVLGHHRATGYDRPTLVVKPPALRTIASLTLTERANSLVQAACATCDLAINPDGSFVYSVQFPIDVMPWTAQSHPRKVELREAVKHELSQQGHLTPIHDRQLCARVVAAVPRRSATKDADNIVKGLLDSLQGVVYANDRQVQCLSSRVVRYAGSEGFYLVNIRAVHPWDADIAYDDPAAPVILSGRPVRLGQPSSR